MILLIWGLISTKFHCGEVFPKQKVSTLFSNKDNKVCANMVVTSLTLRFHEFNAWEGSSSFSNPFQFNMWPCPQGKGNRIEKWKEKE